MDLKQGDTIGIIALSGNCDKNKVEEAVKNIESLGYKVKLSKNIFDNNRYLAGSDDDKISELNNFFEDKDIKLILCARGGYGAIRIINKIDYNSIKSNQKPFCGFSDVTALLLMIYKQCNIVTYHSPMACTDFSDKSFSKNNVTIKNFFEVINGKTQKYYAKEVFYSGRAKGIMYGGNLSTVVSLCGLNFIPEENFIFFAEDLNEPVYKIDKMFQQLFNISTFRKYCKGVVLGDFLNTDNDYWLEEYFKELSDRIQIPMAKGFNITHNSIKYTIPIGKYGELKDNVLTV